MITGLRGFFLADPEELSLIALVDQFANSDELGPGNLYRIVGGNDRLPAALAEKFSDRVRLGSELVAVSVRGQLTSTRPSNTTRTATMTADYLVLALPASVMRRVPIVPALPAAQHQAIVARLRARDEDAAAVRSPVLARAGQAARLRVGDVLRRGVGRQTKNRAGKPGILSLLAGGGASDATQAATSSDGIEKFAASLSWLGNGRRSSSRRGRSSGKPIRSREAVMRFSVHPSTLASRLACASGGPPVLRGRAHQHALAGLYERRGRERPTGRARGAGHGTVGKPPNSGSSVTFGAHTVIGVK